MRHQATENNRGIRTMWRRLLTFASSHGNLAAARSGQRGRRHATAWLGGRLIARCGIGNPGAFGNTGAASSAIRTNHPQG